MSYDGFSNRPVVFCEECGLCMLYQREDSGETVILHPECSCERSGMKFKVPTFELQGIDEQPEFHAVNYKDWLNSQ